MQMKQIIEMRAEDIRDMLKQYIVAKNPELPEGFTVAQAYVEVPEESHRDCMPMMMMGGFPIFSGGRRSNSLSKITITNLDSPLNVLLNIPTKEAAPVDAPATEPAPAFDIADPVIVSKKEKAPLKKRTRR